MPDTLVSILVGLVVVIAVTALTGYFVAQEFGYVSVDRSRLRAQAEAGDEAARRALGVTRRTSFMLSGAQLGITVTGLVVGYVAEPLIGTSIAELMGFIEAPRWLLTAIGAALALSLATAIQMVFGELVPKNYAIARPERTAKVLALSTTIYLSAFGWVIRWFDSAANALLRALGIEPVHDVDEAATPRDLEAIIDTSRDRGRIPADLSLLLDRVLDFTERTARTAMIPRPDVDMVHADEPLPVLVERMSRGHSRYPVIGDGPDDVVGIVHLRDVLALPPTGRPDATAASLARPALFVPDTLSLPDLLTRMRTERHEMACVLDEFGGLAGIITVEDVAEEVVGEISDEHDSEEAWPRRDETGWTVPGTLSVEETERLIGRDLPHGPFSTVAGLVTDRLNRLARSGDVLILDLHDTVDGIDRDEDLTRHEDEVDDAGHRSGPTSRPRLLEVTVMSVRRRVPSRLRLRWRDAPSAEGLPTDGARPRQDVDRVPGSTRGPGAGAGR